MYVCVIQILWGYLNECFTNANVLDNNFVLCIFIRNVLIFIRLTEPVFVALRYPKNIDDFDVRIICERNVVPLLHGSAFVNATANDEM